MTAARTRKARALDRLRPDEATNVLRSLLEQHPELNVEAEDLACAAVNDVDVEAIADDVEQEVLALDIDDLGARAGCKSWGYVEPTEAAWEMLDEAIDPFLNEMSRQIELGFQASAVATCQGIVLGLYRCRGKSSDQILGWAEDFPAETAGHAAATLARESTARHRCTWQLSHDFVDQVPEWREMLERAARGDRW